MNSTKIPIEIKASPPTFTIPRFVNTSHFSLSDSFGSGLWSQSSFSTSSGNRSSPADGMMLYFSDTVWVFTLSSSLPALDGALESSNGEMKGPWRLSLLLALSELQLVRRDDMFEPEAASNCGLS
jgi:hypothetical protein